MSDNKPLHEQAYDDYKNGAKGKDIAQKYNVSPATVRSWKSRYWNKNDNDNVQQSNDNVATKDKRCNDNRKRGAQPGNKNAVGNSGGAPIGSKNNYKHGLYEKLRSTTLSSEEQDLLLDIDTIDIETKLRRIIRECDLNILKFNKAIHTAETMPESEYVHRGIEKTVTSHSNNDCDNEEDESLGKKSSVDTVQTNTLTKHDLILRYANELQKWEGKRIRCIETLIKYGFESERLAMEKRKLEMDQSGDGNMGMLIASLNKSRKQRGDTE